MAFIPIIGESRNEVEEAANEIGEYVNEAGLAIDQCEFLFLVLAVRCSAHRGKSKEEFLNFAAKVFERKSEFGIRPKRGSFLEV